MTSIDNLPLLKVEPVDFRKALSVVNRTRRFVIYIPKLHDGGEPLVYPEGCDRAGQLMTPGVQGQPDRGVVFFNGKDQAWQSVKGIGEDTILVNDVSDEEADLLLKKYRELIIEHEQIGTTQIKQFLAYATHELGIVDFYNKRRFSVERDMAVIHQDNPFYMEVKNPALHKAIYVPDGFTFDGPVKQVFPEGAVIVNKGKYSWGVDSGVFLRSYRALVSCKERKLGSLEQELGIKGRTKRV
ncbi:hypothetical protein [Hahella ganghwensis]|uniref:hypothetical protein n=1 Tax=Hahella ganghwensis TaxID=286420 RepID=UPI000362470C|nr:hypothetical protein [Hahella ganghwensis]